MAFHKLESKGMIQKAESYEYRGREILPFYEVKIRCINHLRIKLSLEVRGTPNLNKFFFFLFSISFFCLFVFVCLSDLCVLKEG